MTEDCSRSMHIEDRFESIRATSVVWQVKLRAASLLAIPSPNVRRCALARREPCGATIRCVRCAPAGVLIIDIRSPGGPDWERWPLFSSECLCSFPWLFASPAQKLEAFNRRADLDESARERGVKRVPVDRRVRRDAQCSAWLHERVPRLGNYPLVAAACGAGARLRENAPPARCAFAGDSVAHVALRSSARR